MELKHIPVRPRNPFLGWEGKMAAALFFLFVATWVLALVQFWTATPRLVSHHSALGLLVAASAASSIASLCRQLPAQNAIFGAVLIGLVTGTIQAFNASIGIPFGPMEYHRENIGQFVFGALPWALPLVWILMILNARGVARLILRSRRRKPNYGFWVMGATVALVVVFQFSFQPYATIVEDFWIWKLTKLSSSWYSTPWTNFLGTAVMTLLILLFVTPLFINKSPNQKPPAYHPLIMWELLSCLFLTGLLARHLWGAAVFTIAQMTFVIAAALLGANKINRPGNSMPSSASPASTT